MVLANVFMLGALDFWLGKPRYSLPLHFRSFSQVDPARAIQTEHLFDWISSGVKSWLPQGALVDYRFRILHIADPHFSRCHFLGSNPTEIAEKHAVELEQQLILHKLNTRRTDALIFSGDFTFACCQDGFEAAIVFIERISAFTRARSVLVVPGNHDMNLSEPVRVGNLSLPTSKEEAEGPFREFLARLARDVGPASNTLSMVTRLNRPGKGLIIVGLNSCRVERRDAQGWGYIGIDQIYEVAAKLRGTGGAVRAHDGDLVVAVTHHNLLPIWDVGLDVVSSIPEKRKLSFVMDAGGSLGFLADLGVSLILHGHTHVQSFKRVEGYGDSERRNEPTMIMGAGTLGLAEAGVGPHTDDPLHHFQVLEIADDMLYCQDLSTLSSLRDSPREWNATGPEVKGFFHSKWNTERVTKALNSYKYASKRAKSDGEKYQSWSMLREKVLRPGTWNETQERIAVTVQKIIPATKVDMVRLAIEDIVNNPPSEYQICNYDLFQMILLRLKK